MKIRGLNLYEQYLEIEDEVNQAILEVIKSSGYINGEYVSKFEKEFGEFCNVENCIGVGNGTDALEIIIEAMGLEKGEIIVPGNSFVATAEAVSRAGHTPAFSDIECNTFNLDPTKIVINKKTRAIIAVHLYGQPANLKALKKICLTNNIALIEDCAQAHGAFHNGERIGGIGDAAAFSFYPGKNLGAYGDAGAITTNNSDLANICRRIANHGRLKKFDHEIIGRNSRLDGIQAAILRIKLKKLDGWNKRRQEIATIYNSELMGVGDLKLPTVEIFNSHVYHQYVIRSKYRDNIIKIFEENEIEYGIHYPIPIPMVNAYFRESEKYMNSEYWEISKEIISLPIGETLTNESAEFIAKIIKNFFK